MKKNWNGFYLGKCLQKLSKKKCIGSAPNVDSSIKSNFSLFKAYHIEEYLGKTVLIPPLCMVMCSVQMCTLQYGKFKRGQSLHSSFITKKKHHCILDNNISVFFTVKPLNGTKYIQCSVLFYAQPLKSYNGFNNRQ